MDEPADLTDEIDVLDDRDALVQKLGRNDPDMEDPGMDEAEYRSRFVMQFASILKATHGWTDEDAREEAHGVLDGLLRDWPAEEHERAYPVDEANFAYRDWSGAAYHDWLCALSDLGNIVDDGERADGEYEYVFYERRAKTPTGIENLTSEQAARMENHARRWIDVHLRTGAADCATFEAAARKCYERMCMPWHSNVVWVASPGMLVLAARIAACLRAWGHTSLAGELRETVLAVTTAAVLATVDEVLRGAEAAYRRSPVHSPTCRPFLLDSHYYKQTIKVADAVHSMFRKVDEAVRDRVVLNVRDTVDRMLLSVVRSSVNGVGDVVRAAMLRAERKMISQLDGIPAAGKLIADKIREADSDFFTGQLRNDSGYLGAVSSYYREVCGLQADLRSHAIACEQMMQSACWWYAHWDFLIVCGHPLQVHREWDDQRGRHQPHCLDGPAISFLDGWAVYALHGREVPAWIIEHPERITPQAIEQEGNAETRRDMIERYGWTRYITDCGSEVIDQAGDDHPVSGLRGARLLRKELPGEPEPIVYLEMRNSTPEPDGTYRRYLERIDPKAYGGDAGRLCHAAMASRWRHRDEEGQLQLTFERWQDYHPTAES